MMGSAEQQREMLAQTIISTLERAVDSELEKLENLDDHDLHRIRHERAKAMKEREDERRSWAQNDHGRLTEVDDERQFFAVAKKSRRVVVLFYRSGSEVCDVLKQHIQRLAESHMETKFIAVSAEKTPFLVERLKIWMMPTVLCVREGKTEKQFLGLDPYGGSTSFHTSEVEKVLFKEDMLDNQSIADTTSSAVDTLRRAHVVDDDDLDWD